MGPRTVYFDESTFSFEFGTMFISAKHYLLSEELLPIVAFGEI